jgi:hypothetical protein
LKHSTVTNQNDSRALAEPVATCPLERVKGIEPSAEHSQTVERQSVIEHPDGAYTQIRAQIQGNGGRDLAQVVNAWPELPAALKAAILAIVNSSADKGDR